MKITNFFKILIFFQLLFLLFFLTDCANIQAPSGGPKDSIPPVIIGCYPTDMTTVFQGKDIRIAFSEWPDRNGVIKNISISPPIELEYSWSGTKLKIGFLNPLKVNTTYSFLLGTEYMDLAGNKPDSAFSVTFSTGSVIDSGKIEGMLYGEKVAGAYIYGYRTDIKNPDTLNIENAAAEYKTQVGTNGSFALRALPDGIYRLFAVKTEFKDNLFHPNTDFLATLVQDIEVKQGTATQAKMKLTAYPNLQKNQIISEIQAGEKLIEFAFTKPFQNTVANIPVNSFLQLIDSSSMKTTPLKAVYLDTFLTNKILVKLEDTLLPDKQYTLNVLKDSVLRDTSGIYLSKMSFSFQPKVTNRIINFAMNYAPFADSARGVDFYKEIVFNFNNPILFDSTADYFTLKKSSEDVAVDFNLIQNTPNSLKIIPKMEFLPDNWYRLMLNMGKISSVDGEKLKDTVIKYDFNTADWRTFPKVSGTVENKINCSNVKVVLIPNDPGMKYETEIAADGTWVFPRVKPGKYLLELYCDADDNGKYDSGLAFPFKFAENFAKFTNIIEVKERWDVENIKLTFENK